MIRGTTPTFTLTIPSDSGVDLTQAANVYATFKQTGVAITKSGEDLTVQAHQVDVYLNQAETLQFKAGTLQIQLNWTYSNASRACSTIVNIGIDNNLVGEVLA